MREKYNNKNRNNESKNQLATLRGRICSKGTGKVGRGKGAIVCM